MQLKEYPSVIDKVAIKYADPDYELKNRIKSYQRLGLSQGQMLLREQNRARI